MDPKAFQIFTIGICQTLLSDSELDWMPLMFELPNAPAVNDIIDNDISVWQFEEVLLQHVWMNLVPYKKLVGY